MYIYIYKMSQFWWKYYLACVISNLWQELSPIKDIRA